MKRVLILIILIMLMIVSINRNIVWKTGLSLWSDNVKKSPKKARPNLNLGLAFLKEDRWQEAEPFFRRVLEINPDFYRAKYSLSEVLFNLGRYEEALVYLKEVESAYLVLADAGRGSKKRGMEIYHNIAACYHRLGNLKEAEIYYKKAIDIAPDPIRPIEGLIDLLIEQNRKEDAIFYIEKLLAIVDNKYENREKLKDILEKLKKRD